MKIIKNFNDYYDWMIDPTDTPVYNRVTRYSQLENNELPIEIINLQKYLEKEYQYRFNQYKYFQTDLIVIGIYPDVMFYPIDVIKRPDDIYNPEYKILDYSDLKFIKEVFEKEKHPQKFLIESGLFNQNNCPVTFDSLYDEYFDRDNYYNSNKYRHVSRLGNYIEFNELLDCYSLKCNKLFKLLGCPIFITDLNFYDYLCNLNLSKITLNLSYYNGSRQNFIDLHVTKTFKEKLNDIPDRIEEYLTSANDVNDKSVDDKTKIISHGFDIKTSFRNVK